MPIPISSVQGHADGADRLPMLERELGSLRRELETIRSSSRGDGARHVMNGWISTALAGFALLLALVALIRG